MPHHPITEVPDEFDPGSPSVEPNERPLLAHIPNVPERERVIDPGENDGKLAQNFDHKIEAASCL
jgi:hypothetical protein